jgi:hypothetical protein
MKKLLVLVIAVALVVWVVSWFYTPQAVTTSASKPWPGGLGSLDDAGDRLKPMQANEASAKLTALANALPKNEALDEFVWREISRGELTIGGSPSVPDVSAIRELLLREPIVWQRRVAFDDTEMGTRRTMQLAVARTLVATALVKARANDPAAWDDLHAVWKLARSIDGHPQMMAQTAALTMARMINAVAWKMPLPAPEWFGDVQERDNVPALIEAFHYQSASYAKDGSTLFPTKMLANSVDHDRAIAESLLRETRCDVNAPMNDLGVDLSFVWRRAFRYRAEREATANALRVREGKPIQSKSSCSDGSWAFDGTTLRFSREIRTEAPDRPMSLVLRFTR